ATYYGGTGDDNPSSIACDNLSGIVIGGTTTSTSGIASVGAFQTVLTGNYAGFIASFDSNGVRRWSTYYSGNGYLPGPPPPVFKSITTGSSVAIDSGGNILLIGETGSTSGIATIGAYQTAIHITNNAANQDLFIAKFSA